MKKIVVTHNKENLYELVNKFSFSIPPFQRFYAWTPELVRGLFEDVMEGIVNRKPIFLGLVFLKGKEHAQRFEIIDGQQRIVTFLVLLRALTAKLSKADAARLSEWLKTQTFSASKLDLNVAHANKFFKDYILNGEDSALRDPALDKRKAYARSLRKCYEIMLELVRTEIKDQKQARKVFLYLKEHIEVIYIVTSDDLQAFEIFESINAKKLELNIADLTKNLVLRRSKGVSQEQYDKTLVVWEEFVDVFYSAPKELDPLGPHEIPKFFRAWWASKYGSDKARGNRFYLGFKKELSQKKDPIDAAKEIFANAKIYRSLMLPSMEDYSGELSLEIRTSLRNLRRLGLRTAHPLLLKSKMLLTYSAKDFLELCQVVEHLSFVKLVLFGERPPDVEKMYSSLLQKVDKKTGWGINPILKAELAKYKEAFQTEIIGKNDFSNREGGYILSKVLQSKLHSKMLSSLEAASDNVSKSVEHIMPEDYTLWVTDIQGVISKLPRRSGYEAILSAQDPVGTYHSGFCQKIGNLSLLLNTQNSELGNAAFKDKVVVYKKDEAGNPLFDGIINMTEWTAIDIDSRSKKIAEDFEKIIFG